MRVFVLAVNEEGERKVRDKDLYAQSSFIHFRPHHPPERLLHLLLLLGDCVARQEASHEALDAGGRFVRGKRHWTAASPHKTCEMSRNHPLREKDGVIFV